MISFLDVAKQNAELSVALEEVFHRVLNSKKLSLGPEVVVFERMWANFCGMHFAVGVGNGYDGMKLLLMANDIGAGDAVIVAANTHIATWYAVKTVGAEILAVEPDYSKRYCLSADDVREYIDNLSYWNRRKLKAILATQLYGSYDEAKSLEQLAREKGLLLFFDACQSHGGFDCYGDGAVFSFYPTKNLGALGDGGAVVTNSDDVYCMIRALRNYGGDIQNEHMCADACNSRLDEIQAGFLRVKLKKLMEWNNRRINTARMYNEAFVDTPMQLPKIENSVFHQYVLSMNSRDSFRDRLKRNKIETMIHYPMSPHMQPAFVTYKAWNLKATETMVKKIVSMPIGPELTEAEVQTIIEVTKGHTW